MSQDLTREQIEEIRNAKYPWAFLSRLIHGKPSGSDEPDNAIRALCDMALRAPQWVAVSERLPESGAHVIAYYRNALGKNRRVRAMWVAKHSLEDCTDGSDFSEYDEKSDAYYWPEGWYETNEHEETHWRVDEEVTHWQPLPPLPSPERTP